MVFEIDKLPYSYNALEPWIDAKTMEIHHDKHHKTYADKFNSAVEKYPNLQKKNAEELLANNLMIVPEEIETSVRNHGGGFVNHNFFWKVMAPAKKSGKPSNDLMDEIEKTFEGFDKFKEKFKDVAMNRFGSGWAWFVLNPKTKKLEIISTANQDSPISLGLVPLLTIDVWEHAYYLKFNQKRADYVDSWFNVVDWKKVSELYEEAK